MRACSAGNSSSHSGSRRSSASRTVASGSSAPSDFAARHVAMTTSGDLSSARSWSMTAASMAAADTRRICGVRDLALQRGLADVVAIELAAAAGVGRAHGAAGRPEQQALQQRWRRRPRAARARPRALAQDRLRLVPEGLADDRRVLAGIGDALVDGEADVHAVAQDLVETALVDDAAAVAADVFGPELSSERGRRADLQEPLEDHPDDRGLRLRG